MLNVLNNPTFMDAAINAGATLTLLLGLGILVSLLFGAAVAAPVRRKR